MGSEMCIRDRNCSLPWPSGIGCITGDASPVPACSRASPRLQGTLPAQGQKNPFPNGHRPPPCMLVSCAAFFLPTQNHSIRYGLCFADGVDTFMAPGAPWGAGMLERLFQLRAHNTNVRTEILAGVTTFLAMAYILFVNPSILGETGICLLYTSPSPRDS